MGLVCFPLHPKADIKSLIVSKSKLWNGVLIAEHIEKVGLIG